MGAINSCRVLAPKMEWSKHPGGNPAHLPSEGFVGEATAWLGEGTETPAGSGGINSLLWQPFQRTCGVSESCRDLALLVSSSPDGASKDSCGAGQAFLWLRE